MDPYWFISEQDTKKRQLSFVLISFLIVFVLSLLIVASPLFSILNSSWIFAFSVIPAIIFGFGSTVLGRQYWIASERRRESRLNRAKSLLCTPPQRNAFELALQEANAAGKRMLDKYLFGFNLESGIPLWISDNAICQHVCAISKNGFDKTSWFHSLMLQQMLRARASGFTFIDQKKDSNSLNHLIMMAIHSGRIEDLIIIDPQNPLHSYNFVLSNQSADVKATKILKATIASESLGAINKNSNLGSDYIYRIIRILENLKLSWSLKDLAAVLSNFSIAFPYLRKLLNDNGNRQALTELGQLVSGNNDSNGLRKDADEMLNELSSDLKIFIKNTLSNNFCNNDSVLNLTDAIFRGKIIYYKAPYDEDVRVSDLATRVFREDLKISMAEVAASRTYSLEDPHMIFIDEDSSNFGANWNSLFEAANNSFFSLLFGVASKYSANQMPVGLNPSFCEKILPKAGLKVFLGIETSCHPEELSEFIEKSASSAKQVPFNSEFQESDIGNIDSNSYSGRIDGAEQINSEKEVAWFDFNDGALVRGSALTVKTDDPENWNGRKLVERFENFFKDEVGLSSWIRLQKQKV